MISARKPNNCRVNTTSKQFDGLIAWWNCDYPDDNFLYDPIGGHTATLNGTLAENTWVIDAERAYVPQFDGTTNYFSTPDSPALELTGPFTISFWLDSTEPLEKIILEKDGFVGYSVRTIGTSGSSEIELTVGGDGNTIVTANNWTDGDGWHLITFVYRGVNDAVVYVDGLVDTDTRVGVTVGTPSYGSGTFDIGGNNTSAPSLDGKLDDIRIYNRELSQTEVQQLYHPQTRYELWLKEPEPIPVLFLEITIHNEAESGGVEVGGSATITLFNIVKVGGGIKVSGESLPFVASNKDASGGVEVNGEATEEHISGTTTPRTKGSLMLNKYPPLPPDVWDNPLPEDKEVYEEFVRAYSASNAKYQAHYLEWRESEGGLAQGEAFENVRALAYGADCTSAHLNCSAYGCINTDLISLYEFDSSADPWKDYASSYDLTSDYPPGLAGYGMVGSDMPELAGGDYSTGEYLNNTEVPLTTKEDFTVALWVSGTDAPSDFTVIVGGHKWDLVYDPFNSRFRFSVGHGVDVVLVNTDSVAPIGLHDTTRLIVLRKDDTHISIQMKWGVSESFDCETHPNNISYAEDDGFGISDVVTYNGSGLGTERFMGWVDEIGLWQRCLSNSEVEWLWGGGAGRLLSTLCGGGVELGGAAAIDGHWHNVADGGVEVSGNATVTLINIAEVSGGVEVSGNATVTLINIAEVSGGVEVSGNATVTLINIAEVSGGVEVGEEADETFSDVIETSGGIKVNGFATTTFFDTEIMEGGVVVGGLAVVVRIPAGNETYNETMDGGVIVDGASANNSISTEQGQGGVVINGTTVDNHIAETIPEGGVEIGGTSTITLYNTVDTNGGVLVNGLGSISGQTTHFPDGGVVVNGAAPFGKVYTDTPDGGVVVGGEHNIEWLAWPRPEGGVLVDGEVLEDSTYNVATDGGVIVVGGEAVYDEIMDGGVKAGGLVLILHIVEVSGGIKVGGNGSMSITFVPEGGVVVSPIPGEEFKANICPCIIQSRVLSLNELNFLDQRIFVKELQDRTERKALVWKSLETLVRFKSTELPFDYYLTQMGTEVVLDISKEDKFFGSFSSSIHPEIQDIFDYVAFTIKGDRSLKNTMDSIWGIERCP